jgi:hypothetical protein
MEPYQPTFFEKARDRVEPMLEASGFSIAEAVYQPAAFGSAYIIHAAQRCCGRLVWDGKKGALSAQCGKRVRSWQVDGWREVESGLDRDLTEARIQHLVTALKSAVDLFNDEDAT